ncbi:hypothetical protein CL634_10025 [bacterium]|nr:hypothetical protein [bacterium]
MEVGDLVRTTRTGAGIGDTWTRPGVMCVVTKIKKVPVNPSLKRFPVVNNIMVTVLIPSLGVERTFHKAGLEVINEGR